MANKLSHWLIGCGIGCGALVLIAVALIGGGVVYIRDMFKDFGGAAESQRALDERFGAPADFVLWSEGTVPADRIEAFLTVRKATDPERRRIAELLGKLLESEAAARAVESKGALEKMRFALGVGRSAFGMAEELGGLLLARNRALLEQGMAPGEYGYLYCLAYHAYLRHSPGDGPVTEALRINVGKSVGGGDGAEAERSSKGVESRAMQHRVRGALLDMLRGARASLPEQPVTEAAREWQQALVAEIEAMEKDTDRLPWQDGAPPVVASALEPYRERLEATYNPLTNPFELAESEPSNQFGFQVR